MRFSIQGAFHAAMISTLAWAGPSAAQGNPAGSTSPQPLPPAPVAPPLPPTSGPGPGPWQEVDERPPPPIEASAGELFRSVAGFLSKHRDTLGRVCTLQAIQRSGDQVYAACGYSGLWVVDIADDYELNGIYDVGGYAKSLTVQQGRVWVNVVRVSSFPVDVAQRVGAAAVPVPVPVPPADAHPLSPPLTRQEVDVPPAPPEPSPQPPPASPVRHVKWVSGSGVMIVGGTISGIREGARFSVYREGSRDRWVGVVKTAWDDEALLEFGNNEPPLDVTLAAPTSSQTTASWLAPPRVKGVWEIQAMLRPFLPVDPSGFGVLAEASVGYRFDYFHLWGELSPAGFALSDGEAGTISGQLTAAIDTELFEVGLGTGAQTVNTPNDFNPPGSGLALSMFLRVGAIDGLNIGMRATEALFHRRFEFTQLDIAAQIPLVTGNWLILRGGGGAVGYALGEVRLRTRVIGNGLGTSVFLHVAGGASGVLLSCFDTATTVCFGGTPSSGGPHAGIGGEWRF